MTSSRLKCFHQFSAAATERRAVSFLCRGGAWKWAALAYTLASVATAAGCSFTDFSKTEPPPPGPVVEPACLGPSALGDAASATAETVAHFTFDNVTSNGQWLDEQGLHALVPGSDDATAAIAALADIPRINGTGQSLKLDGHQYARVGAEDLLGSSRTVAAWISVPARVFTSDGTPTFSWTILSAFSDDEHCNGYQIDIASHKQSDGTTRAQPELVLSFQSRPKVDSGAPPCVVQSLHAPLDVPSWATGTGRWHHVAGTLAQLGDGTVQSALFWDGVRIRVQDPLEPLPVMNSGGLAGDGALYVGTSALELASAAQTKFTGYIDDIAIFGRPLTEQELHDFVLATTTYSGPSNCRWRASEQWDDTAFDGQYSYAQWSTQSTPTALQVDIFDYNWGAGALDARIEPPRDLQLYDTAYLDGDFPVGKAFQFTIASGDNYCTWTYLGKGPARYAIDLTKPVSCVSTTCEVDFHRVDRASVTSEWSIPKDDAPFRTTGQETFVVSGLEFAKASGALPNWTGYGGAYGLLGYCWRLQAYEPETSAWWNQADAAIWSQAMTAVLKGPRNSGARLMADFGEQGLDISACDGVTLEAALDSTTSTSFAYVLAIQDTYGSWRSYNLSESTAGSGKYDVELDSQFSSSASDKNFGNFPNHAIMDLHKVHLLGVQKPWLYDGVPLNVTINGLEFRPPNCAVPGPV